jgi:hypothetical protein
MGGILVMGFLGTQGGVAPGVWIERSVQRHLTPELSQTLGNFCPCGPEPPASRSASPATPRAFTGLVAVPASFSRGFSVDRGDQDHRAPNAPPAIGIGNAAVKLIANIAAETVDVVLRDQERREQAPRSSGRSLAARCV